MKLFRYLLATLLFSLTAQVFADAPPGLTVPAGQPDPFSIAPSASPRQPRLADKPVPANIEVSGTRTDTISLMNPINITALSITGDVAFLNTSSGSVKVILNDPTTGKDYLVYESYPSLTDTPSFSIDEACEESCVLPLIATVKLRIETQEAYIRIRELQYADTPRAGDPTAIRLSINAIKIDKLNSQRLGWVAGETPVSMLTYEEKKWLFIESKVPTNLQGFEYYKGGIFTIQYSTPLPSPSPTSLVSSFDWRNRHGKNWMTSIKDQSPCGTCAIFASTGALEAVANVYFNQQLNLDLSEQENVSCGRLQGVCHPERGTQPSEVIDYFRQNGVVNESCFPYNTDKSVSPDCGNRCSSPVERIQGSGRLDFGTSAYPRTDEVLKRMIIENGPISGGVYTFSHAMALAGYDRDTDGRTVWIFKNSWGQSWGEGGYGRVKLKIDDIGWTYALRNPIVSAKSRSISCVDNDKDQYCNWGISATKPSTCPASCKPQKDCDDSNPALGPFESSYSCALINTLVQTKQFTIYNDGNAALSVTSIQPEKTTSWITAVSPRSFSIAAGGSSQVSVTVDKSLVPAGNQTVRLLVNSNDPDENPYPGGVLISATGISPTQDSDADGYPDLTEIQAGTNPFSPTSTPGPTIKLINISTRANILGGQNDAFAGFVLSGTSTQKIMLRGMAAASGVNPKLTLLKRNGTTWESAAVNDEWEQDTSASDIRLLAQNLRLPDTYGNDAGILLHLTSGVYSAQLSSNSGFGLEVVGVDAIGSSGPILTNISTRAHISGGQNDAFAGFVISGTGTLKVMLRGMASASGVNPKLTLLKRNGTAWETVETNDEWETHWNASAVSALASNLRLPDTYGNDAGMLLDLSAGIYTVQLSSTSGPGLAVVGVDTVQ